jgi:hypothetical protein
MLRNYVTITQRNQKGTQTRIINTFRAYPPLHVSASRLTSRIPCKAKSNYTFRLKQKKSEKDKYVFMSFRTTKWYSNRNMKQPWRILCIIEFKKKVKGSRNRPGVAQRVPGGLGSQISLTFGTWRWWSRQPQAPAAFNPRKCSWYSFSLGAESTPGPWYGRKECVTEKSRDPTRNRSRDLPTSSAAP